MSRASARRSPSIKALLIPATGMIAVALLLSGLNALTSSVLAGSDAVADTPLTERETTTPSTVPTTSAAPTTSPKPKTEPAKVAEPTKPVEPPAATTTPPTPEPTQRPTTNRPTTPATPQPTTPPRVTDPNAGKTWHEAITEQVWVVDVPASTKSEAIYLNMVFCTCGANLTEQGISWDAHRSGYSDEERAAVHYGTHHESVITGYQTVPVAEQGHWETKVIRAAGYY